MGTCVYNLPTNHLIKFNPENKISMFLRNVGVLQCMVSEPRMRQSEWQCWRLQRFILIRGAEYCIARGVSVRSEKYDVVRFLAQSCTNAGLCTAERVASSVSSKAMSGFVKLDCMTGFRVKLEKLQFIAFTCRYIEIKLVAGKSCEMLRNLVHVNDNNLW
jgi:hypothetical protein